ncbi:MAG: metal-dependent hydrolase, partial [Phaeodactylibacter sp.]|nr:metal-dependent hydrolase [Phaeodactylibacter sp.]
RRRSWRIGITLFWILLLGLLVNGIAYATGGVLKPGLLIGTVVIAGLLLWLLSRNYWKKDLQTVAGSYWGWVSVFFWSIFTHPLLDSCTPYGTQLFQPFSNYRVALNNVAVVDPAYTLPFLLLLLIALFLARGSRWRAILNWAGIGVSTAYLALTFYHKHQVDQVFESCLERDHIHYERYMTAPTILNNILWQGVAEGDTAYYYGNYSLFDPAPTIPKFEVLPKRHTLISDHWEDRDVRILRWFSNGYFNILEREDGSLQFNDLRYGAFNGRFEKPTDFISRFELHSEEGKLIAHASREAPDVSKATFQAFYNRIMGIRPGY